MQTSMEGLRPDDEPDFAAPAYTYTVVEQFADAAGSEFVTRVVLDGQVEEFRIGIAEEEALVEGYLAWKEKNQ
jgi:hypothetical protein